MNSVRLDRFIMPKTARAALLARIGETHAMLRRQSGFVRDSILERDHPEGTEIVTYAEWDSQAAVAAARVVMADWQARTGFDRAAFLARHGIRADLATLDVIDPPVTD